MKCKLVLHRELSGDYSTIYSIHLEGSKNDKLTEFLLENLAIYPSEVKEILSRLRIIGKKAGAEEDFFKHNEGNPGDGVCALFDRKNSKLRLYCIRYGKQIVVVGSGGHKPKNTRTYQDDPKLNKENKIIKIISKSITECETIGFSRSGLSFTGDLEFEIEYESKELY